MNFDTTHIVIRERGFPEVLDLAVRVVRAHAGPLLLALFAGVMPWALLNGWLLYDAVIDAEIWGDPGGYLFGMFMLMTLESPLATAPITLYLGQVTFTNQVSAKRLAKDYFASLPQMLLLQGVARVLTALLFVTLIMPYVMWPYLSELILLERNPLFGGKSKRFTTTKRSKVLHRGAGGDLFGRWVMSLMVGALLIFALLGGAYTLLGQLLSYDMSTRVLLLVAGPMSAWVVVGFFAVVRFLCYLDLRIRREGWEVELIMRAEAERLRRLA